MREFLLLDSIGPLPEPYDAERLARGMANWREAEAQAPAVTAEFMAAALEHAKGRALLEGIFGNSPYLTRSLLAEPDFVRTLFERSADTSRHAIAAELTRAAGTAANASELMQPLRIAKRRFALLTAIADIAGIWSLEQVTSTLSDFAEQALEIAVARLLADAAAAKEIKLANPSRPSRDSGFVILAMGKLGARELNYSSDIDLMVLFDQDVVQYLGKRSAQDGFVRITQSLVKLMQERTSDGYVFRTDLRLRPDPGATVIALSMAAAESYYESLGQNWERAAMIKARPVAGDLAAGRGFLDRIAPFSWRKNLDFAAIEDIHSIKRQIHAHKGHGVLAVAGHDIKLGRGGIREIEFFAQTQQLIAGGRDRRLRVAATCDAIRALAATDRLTPAIAEELIEAYRFLRRLEHRLQMVDDEQTHTIPGDPAGVAHIAKFFGQADSDDFSAEVLAVLERVQRHYAALFEKAPPLGSTGALVFTGTEDDPETIKTLSKLGFNEPSTIAGIVRGWHHGRYRVMRSTRARELLTAIMPRLLEALARTAHPDTAFARFDEFLGKLPTGIQLFSMLYANPDLLDLIADVMGTAPRLANYLSRNPVLFDGMINAGFFSPLPDQAALAAELSEALASARDFQDMLDISRRWTNDRKLQIGIQLLRGTTDAETAGATIADLADTVLGAILPEVAMAFAQSHGRFEGGGMAIIALGRLGGREMTLESDLDLIFVYDHPTGAEASSGKKSLSPSQYFARLSQRIINAITALTPDGRLFDVDMRLRPSGNAGPIATSLAAFERYQANSAWTWERMALTRARVIAGPPKLMRAIEEIIRANLTRKRDPVSLAADIADMRDKIVAEHPERDPWAVKHVRGGFVDLEFLCQYLQLRHGADKPQVIDSHTGGALAKLAAAGALPAAAARELIDAGRLFGTVLALTRLCQAGRFDAAEAPPGLRAMLARAAGTENFDALADRLVMAQARVLHLFETLIAAPVKAAVVPNVV